MRRPTAILIAALALLVPLGLVACGGGEDVGAVAEEVEGTLPEETTEESPAAGLEGDAAAGESIYASQGCGSCHVLEAAGSAGNIGPNLDETQPDYELSVDRVTNGAGAMPAYEGQLDDQQIADVSAYVVESSQG